MAAFPRAALRPSTSATGASSLDYFTPGRGRGRDEWWLAGRPISAMLDGVSSGEEFYFVERPGGAGRADVPGLAPTSSGSAQ